MRGDEEVVQEAALRGEEGRVDRARPASTLSMSLEISPCRKARRSSPDTVSRARWPEHDSPRSWRWSPDVLVYPSRPPGKVAIALLAGRCGLASPAAHPITRRLACASPSSTTPPAFDGYSPSSQPLGGAEKAFALAALRARAARPRGRGVQSLRLPGGRGRRGLAAVRRRAPGRYGRPDRVPPPAAARIRGARRSILWCCGAPEELNQTAEQRAAAAPPADHRVHVGRIASAGRIRSASTSA